MIRIQQLKCKIAHKEFDIVKAAARVLKVRPEAILSMKIVKQSIDARKKDNIKYTYTVDVSVEDEKNIQKKVNDNNVMLTNIVSYEMPPIKSNKSGTPIIVGSGPAGLFCGYLLAKAGYNPIILERGEAVEQRVQSVDSFWNTGCLNVASNVQFGEGGAGTFSDGKLNTLVKDSAGRNRFILQTLIEAGAPESILYESKPHIGTDLLVTVVQNMRKEILRLGGNFRFSTKATDFQMESGAIKGVLLEDGTFLDSNTVVLAIGHSARDTFETLYAKKVSMEAKSFAVGVRIEHPQEMIQVSQYGQAAAELLPAASYKVTGNLENGRGVYSFCMCPGGYVVNASSEIGGLAINGMSYAKRDSQNANSAMIVTITPADFPSKHPLAGVLFQRDLEEKAYKLGNGKVPVQLFGDFCENKESTSFGLFETSMKGSFAFGNLRTIFPDFLNESLIEGILKCERSIEGFSRKDAILSGVESRTSSPVRILRNKLFESENVKGLYPCGEGAGYAGGIMSAAIDGMKVAEAILNKE